MWEKGGSDHWYQIPLNTPQIRDDIGMFIAGTLFTTRMPRGLDLKPGEPWPGHVKEKFVKQQRTERVYFEEQGVS
jgi:hypothetical protein